MKSILTSLAIALIFNFNSYCQTGYEKGYFINDNGEKVEGLIKNADWKNNPVEFTFKLSDDDQPQAWTIGYVKEFGINGKTKYLRATVNIDRSSESLKSLDRASQTAFVEEQLFLKVLIEGKASLYSYEDRDLKRFFFKTENLGLRQLVFKTYLTSANRVAENNHYKQQLLSELKCSGLSGKEIEKTDYRSRELIDLFTQYNDCENVEFRQYSPNEGKTNFQLSLKAGIKNSALEIANSESSARDTDFGSKIGFRIGLEAEFILPFHNDKWGILIEPTYQSFISEKEGIGLDSRVNYRSLEVPFGIRHYMFLSEVSKLFVNGLVVMDLDFNSTFEFTRQGALSSLDINPGTNLAVGFGYNYNNQYSAEIRYYTPRDLLTNYGPWASDYNTLSLIFGYTLF
ncbi:hypothetical protein [Salinimicrobium terrae]|uniref:hypothetical protein n=1 Tax=Salinimicrobium terrae TaxID=470866 RepID=UPI00049220B8|nr:hypothetical protein [Salinimicrobium terrae]